MWKFAAGVIERFSGLTPMKAFIRYIFKRVSNDFLDHEPVVDFRKGQLELIDLPLSAQKINQTFLMSSPYIMHSGVLRKLKVTVPSLTEITSKSIEVEVSGLELVFYPNKLFMERFNEQMRQMKENSKFYDMDEKVRDSIEFSEDDSLDFFKEIIRQILTNIRVSVINVTVKVFMNTPSQDQSCLKPQYYTMLRIPSIVVERGKDDESIGELEEIEKYQLTIPQISAHLLREDTRSPEYSNVKSQKGQYPSANHPSTILLIGKSDMASENQSLTLFLSVKKEHKTKTKRFHVRGIVPNIEVMLEPFQIQIIEMFLSQLNEFKTLYQHSMEGLGRQDRELFNKFNDISRDFSLRESVRGSVDMHTSMDIFSSLAMAFEDTENKPSARGVSYFDSIMDEDNSEAKQLRSNLTNFNKNVSQEVRQKLKAELTMKFSNTVQTNVDVGFIRVYILKHSSSTSLVDYERVWTKVQKNKPLSINEGIPSGYFMLSVRNLGVESEDKEVVSVSVKKITLLNVKLAANHKGDQENKANKEDAFEESDIFHSFDTINNSSSHNSMGIPINRTNNIQTLKSLVRYERSPHQHYCGSYILWMSFKDPRLAKSKSFGKVYCLTSAQKEEEGNILEWGLLIKLTKKSSKETVLNVTVKRVGVLLDCEVVKDLINIMNPLFAYRNLLQSINLKKQELRFDVDKTQKSPIKSSLNYSNYDLNVESAIQETEQQPRSSRSQFIVEFSFSNINLGFADMDNLGPELIDIERKKVKDSESFEGHCFCDYESDCVSVEVNKLRVLLAARNKVSLKNSCLCLKHISSSKYTQKTMIVSTPDDALNNRVYIETVANKGEKSTKISLHIPHLKIDVEKKECFRVTQMVKRVGGCYKALTAYLRHLQNEFKKLNNTQSEAKSKKIQTVKADQTLVVHVQKLQASILDVELYVLDILFASEEKQASLKVNHLLLLHLNKDDPLLKSTPIETKTLLRHFGKEINTSSIVLQINPEAQLSSEFLTTTKDREFFKKVETQPYSLVVSVSQQEDKSDQNGKITDLKNSGRFGFVKRRQLEIISEEEEQKFISFSINDPVVLRACEIKNLVYLKEDIEEISKVVEATGVIEMFNAPTVSCRRKDSDLPPQRRKKFTLKVKELNVDVFPYEDLKQSPTILSSTRSFLSLEGLGLQVESSLISNEDGDHLSLTNLNVELKKAEVFFLYFNDTDVHKNPLLIPKEDVLNFGFKRVSTVSVVSAVIKHEVSVFTNNALLQVSVKVDNIEGECSAMTTVFAQHHVDTIVRMGKVLMGDPLPTANKNSFETMVKQLSSEEQPEDLDEMVKSLKREEELRTLEESEFKNRTLDFMQTHLEGKVKGVDLKLEVKRISVSVFSGDDFSFLEGTELPILEPLVFELDDKNQVVCREEIPDVSSDTRRRFRKKDVDKYTNMRFVGQGLSLELCKYRSRGREEDNLSVRALFRIRTINCLVNKIGQDIFYLLKTSEKTSIAFEIQGAKIKAKQFLPECIHAGYTSNLNFFWNQREQAKTHLNKTAYLVPIQSSQEIDIDQKENVYEILVLVPKTKLIINLQMIGWKFLSNQEVSTLQLFFHNKLSRYMEEDNNKVMMKWITDTLTSNMGSILANGFITLFSRAIWFFLGCLKQVILFPGTVFRVLKSNSNKK